MQSHWRPTLAIAALAFVSVTWTALAQTGRTVADGVYTDPQATRGQAVYARECQACHGTTLSGGLGPPLAGVGFLQAWDTLSLADLVDKIQKTMPATDPGTLSRAEATDVVAYVLKASKFPAGPAELSSDPATLTNLALGGPRDGAPAQTLPSGRPPGNLAQVMRGILFPSSNLIFNVQNQDPGEEKGGMVTRNHVVCMGRLGSRHLFRMGTRRLRRHRDRRIGAASPTAGTALRERQAGACRAARLGAVHGGDGRRRTGRLPRIAVAEPRSGQRGDESDRRCMPAMSRRLSRQARRHNHRSIQQGRALRPVTGKDEGPGIAVPGPFSGELGFS